MKFSLSKMIVYMALAISTFMPTSVLAVDNSGSDGSGRTNINIVKPPNQIENIGNLVNAGIRLAILVAAVLTLAFLIWGGIEWITSGGDKSKYEAARNRITAALVGLAIVAAAWAIMTLVTQFLGFNDPWTNFNVPSVDDNFTTGK